MRKAVLTALMSGALSHLEAGQTLVVTDEPTPEPDDIRLPDSVDDSGPRNRHERRKQAAFARRRW